MSVPFADCMTFEDGTRHVVLERR